MKKLMLFGLISVVLIAGCTQNSVKQPTCKDVQVPYTENPCPNEIELRLLNVTEIPPYLPANETDCPNLVGSLSYGNYELKWEFANRNDILLGPTCNIVVNKNLVQWTDSSKTDTTITSLQKDVVETIKVNIPAQGTTQLSRTVFMPKCYTDMYLNCTDTKDLPECQPVTKYRTEQQCG